jgi:hypothetical protein
MTTITVNSTDYDARRAREALADSLGALDTKRPTAWAQYGYRTDLTFTDYLRAYERGGVGHGAVHRVLDGCWKDVPRIKEAGSSEAGTWENEVSTALTAINFWGKFKDFDRRNLVGRFSGLIYRVADGRPLSEPLGNGKLVDIVPVYESQIKVLRWDEDANSPTYGTPLEFQYETSSPDDNSGRPRQWVSVHPSRVQILAEGSVNGDFYNGVPLLKAGFNALVDIEKITGGSAESFLKNSARTITVEYDVNATPATIGENGEKVSVKQAHEDQARRLNTNMDATLVTQGAKAGVLQTTIADPSRPFEVAASTFAASVRLPFTVLFGQQTGRLASDEDRADANARYSARRVFELTPALVECVTRLQACKALPEGSFVVEWPDISAPSDADKLKNARELAAINTEVFRAGGSGVLPFDPAEIREAAGCAMDRAE